MSPPISIITPSLNQGRYIERTIRSVLSQDIPGLEYVVVDGGSTDETLAILRHYEGQLSWTSERDGGQAHAINKGIRGTSGPVLGWLNSDDVYYPHALQQVLALFASRPDVDVLYGDAHHIDEEDHFIEWYPTEPWSFERLKDRCFIAQPATFLRRSVVTQHGLLDVGVRYSMDYDYWFRLALNGARFEYVPRLLAATRLHPNAATLAQRVACHMENNDVTRRHLGRTPDRWLFNYAHAVVERKGPHGTGRPLTTFALAGLSIYAGLRWNGRVSSSMLLTLARWLLADSTAAIRQRIRR